ncbi:uncharacterized protein LOC135134921 isoform X2 [Zophobas morio]
MMFLLDKDESLPTVDTETLDEVDDSQIEAGTSQEDYGEDTPSEPTENGPEDVPVLSTENVKSPRGRPPKPKKMKHDKGDTQLNEALQLLKDTHNRYTMSQSQLPADRFNIFSPHVAAKLRTYTPRTQVYVEHAINNILFEADIGYYDTPATNPSLATGTRSSSSTSSVPLLSPQSQYVSDTCMLSPQSLNHNTTNTVADGNLYH